MPDATSPAAIRDRLRAALPAAMKAKDRGAVAALRSVLGAIDNAEAVDVSAVAAAGALELSPVGAGAADAARRELTEADVERIVAAEIADREASAVEYDRLGRPDRAAALRAEVAAVTAALAT